MGQKEKEKILILEKGIEDRDKLKDMLMAEYSVDFVESMETALDNLKERGKYQAVLIDAFMPDGKGFEFLREIKKSKYSHPPVVAMVESYDTQISRKLLCSGVEEYVLKPLEKTVVLNRIKNVIARSNLFKLADNKYELRFDSLTGLYNRHTMYTHIREMLDEHNDVKFGLVILDVNNFSLYNSTLGEKEGDRLLCYIADSVRNMVKDIKFCSYGRVGSDIYCICEPYDKQIIDRQINSLKQNLQKYRKDYMIEMSAGVYIVEDSSVSVEVMFTRADMAAQKNKTEYMTSFRIYDDTMEKSANREQEVVNEMQKALEEGQFVVYLQPKCSLKNGRVYGAEALVRWQHPKKGILSPSTFIPVFEKHGFISRLDYFMWERVCMLIRKWLDQGIKPMPVSVNMSRISMYNPLISDLLEGLVKKYNISPEYVNIEITESAYMDNPNLMKNTLKRLKKAGFIVMMDDFGSGYSSLNTLKEFDVDVVKIDMNFLPEHNNKQKGEKILSSVVGMIEALEMESVIEGVETAEQKRYLEGIGCDFAQGYYFSKPMPAELYQQKYLTA